jgi:hypothetical protein
MIVLAIDPGTVESAFVRFDGDRLLDFGKIGNDSVRGFMRHESGIDHVVVEMFASYGMPVGREVFETCVFIGRLQEAWGDDATWSTLYRKQIVGHICGSGKAKDANVRTALIDRFGGQAAIKKGGKLYGVSKDVWSALAIACTWWDRQHAKEVA